MSERGQSNLRFRISGSEMGFCPISRFPPAVSASNLQVVPLLVFATSRKMLESILYRVVPEVEGMRRLFLCAMMAGACWVALVSRAQTAVQNPPAVANGAAARAVFDQFCVGCHNQKARTA